MSQVLVSSLAVPPRSASILPVVEAIESPKPHLHLNATYSVEVSLQSVEEKRMASQLAYLASQHHTSEYNKLKFGPAGSPIMYIPLSIQLPAQVQEMRFRQARNTHQKSWWPAEPHHSRDLHQNRDRPQGCNMDAARQDIDVSCTQLLNAREPELDDLPVNLNKPIPLLNYPPVLNLRRELSMAMSSPLSVIAIPQLSPRDASRQHNLNIHAKTSESHPINISPIIPIELLALITSHLVPTPPHTAYMFDVPPSLQLNNVAVNASHSPSEALESYPMERTASEGLWTHPNGAGPPAPATFYPNIRQEPTTGVLKDGYISTKHDSTSSVASHPLSIDPRAVIQPHNATAALASLVNPHEGSALVSTGQVRPHSAPPSFIPSISSEIFANGVMCPSPLLVHALPSNSKTDEESGRLETGILSPLDSDASPSVTWTHTLSPSFTPFHTLGNMLLSSCPGKKVRLSGPVKGRGAICRDLAHDLKRVRALGVVCIICCLDDEELEFLGASWPEYSEVARQIGLDVLRIPIPEGLGPATPAQLDEHLSHIIHSYTLKGMPILVHCRGGVGRAGLVACCWILKLGLCGWLPAPMQETNDHPNHINEILKVRKETVQLVERVITTVRRRRSVKAIETYEQVRFLVEFVEYLQSRSRGL